MANVAHEFIPKLRGRGDRTVHQNGGDMTGILTHNRYNPNVFRLLIDEPMLGDPIVDFRVRGNTREEVIRNAVRRAEEEGFHGKIFVEDGEDSFVEV